MKIATGAARICTLTARMQRGALAALSFSSTKILVPAVRRILRKMTHLFDSYRSQSQLPETTVTHLLEFGQHHPAGCQDQQGALAQLSFLPRQLQHCNRYEGAFVVLLRKKTCCHATFVRIMSVHRQTERVTSCTRVATTYKARPNHTVESGNFFSNLFGAATSSTDNCTSPDKILGAILLSKLIVRFPQERKSAIFIVRTSSRGIPEKRGKNESGLFGLQGRYCT